MNHSDILLFAACIYGILNLFSFLLFANDKRKAKKSCWRTSEKTLLISSFFGPFGALAAMRIARHKTQKRKFMLVYLFAFLHLLSAGLILTGNI